MATDQEIRDAGLLYIPKQKYLQNPYNLPIAPVPPPVSEGITNTNAFNNSGGGDGFSVYNPDPNSIVNRNADSTRYNNLMENSFLTGGSNATDPKYLNEPYNPSIKYAQAAYNQANQALAQGVDPNSQGYSSFTGGTLTGLRDIANERIMDNRQNYGAQGQYETVDSPLAYNSQTELNKFKDNYPEYFGLNQSGPKKGLPGIIEKYMTNSFVGKGVGMAKDFLGNMLPTNRRAMLENQLGSRGVMVNDIGQIVQGQGDYDTAANVMAGYNANKMTANTFDKRLAKIAETMDKKGYKGNLQKRVDAIEAAKADFLKSQKESDFMYDETEEEKNKKKKKSNIVTRFLNKKKETKVAADAKAAADAQAVITTPTGGTTTSSGLSAQEQQTLNNAYNAQSQSSRDRQDQAGGSGGGQFDGASSKSSYDSDPTGYSGSFAKGGRAGYFFGGRVNYKKGGRVSFKNGGLASIL